MSVNNRKNISHPVDPYFLLYIGQRNGDFNSFYFLLDVGNVGNVIVIDGIDNGVAVVGYESIKEGWLCGQHEFWFICALGHSKK